MLQILAKSNPNSIFGVRGQLKNLDAKEDEETNPVYGFKRNIIGLIANLLYKNVSAQEYLRKSDGLAALLDCAKIDNRNPFIMQWAIFAIRNALQDNQQNQQLVAQLRKQGIVEENVIDNIRLDWIFAIYMFKNLALIWICISRPISR